VKFLETTLTPMPSVVSLEGTSVRKTNERVVLKDDYSESVADYRVEFDGLAGACESGEVCNDPMHLVVRRVHLVPNGRDGLAIIQNSGPPGCEFTRVVLISRRPVASLKLEWSQTP
jgi:hypothetical protein